MNEQRPPLFVPALIGGTVAGVMCAVPFLNCLCCLWIIGGAMLAAALWAKESSVSLTAGDGTLIGAFTGIFAAGAHSLVSIPLAAINMAFFRNVFTKFSSYTKEMPDGWQDWLAQGAGPFRLSAFFLGLVVTAAIFACLGILGGIIGVALFGKKSMPSSIVPPPFPTPPAGPTA
ncbi:MAG: hypothetical protein ACYDH3_04940 [Candidatus Aminicenantales bacterium]